MVHAWVTQDLRKSIFLLALIMIVICTKRIMMLEVLNLFDYFLALVTSMLSLPRRKSALLLFPGLADINSESFSTSALLLHIFDTRLTSILMDIPLKIKACILRAVRT